MARYAMSHRERPRVVNWALVSRDRARLAQLEPTGADFIAHAPPLQGRKPLN